MNLTIENIELFYTPLTKQLLIDFVKVQYEENTDASDESLKRELIWLFNNNQLDQLFFRECLFSEARLKL